MKKQILVFMGVLASFNTYAYCTPDNETCFDCGTNCVAELTYTKYNNNNNIGIFTVYGTGENGAGEMRRYQSTESPVGSRVTNAPWADKMSEINNIVIKKGISNVGQSAFTGAKNLNNLELTESVLNIEKDAFMDSKLKNVNTLKNVTTIGPRAFERTQLTSVDLSDNLQKIEKWSFAIISTLKEIIIPDSVTEIENDAFHSFPSDGKIYCNNINNRCDQLFEGVVNTGIKPENIVKYTKDGSAFFRNGKWYQSPTDILSGNYIKKRIYTVEEASKASGKKNTIMIRYK